MSILVDPLIDYGRGPNGHKVWCHMMSDGGIDDLHAMAARIGLRRSWFQNKPGHPHYDLTPSKRALAVRYGAEQVSSVEMIERYRASVRPATREEAT